MKDHVLIASACAGLLLAGVVRAGTITCGDVIITDDQDVGQTTQQILNQCGPPTSQDGGNWIYDRSDTGQGVYILHFNSDGQLDSIEQQVDQG